MGNERYDRIQSVLENIVAENVHTDLSRCIVAPFFDLKVIIISEFIHGRFWVGTETGGLPLRGSEVIILFSAIFALQPHDARPEPSSSDIQPHILTAEQSEAIARKIPLTKLTVRWPVSVLNFEKVPLLPLETWHLKLTWPQLNDAEVSDVMRVIHHKSQNINPIPSNAKMTFHLDANPGQTDRQLHRYRKHFRCIDQNEFRELHDAGSVYQRVWPFSMPIDTDRFEDSAGNTLTELEMMQRATGRDDIVVMGDANSILRLGPTAPKDAGNWTSKDSDTLAHFLDIIERIHKSDWKSSKVTMTTATMADDSVENIALQVPGMSAVLVVLPFFRQLHSNDELFNKACNVYKRFCSAEIKISWIEFYQKAFNKLRKENPTVPNLPIKHSELLEIFYYGSGIFHAESQKGAEAELANLLTTHGRPIVIMAVNACLLQILGYASQVYHVIKQDYDSWLELGLARASNIDLDDLFRSHG